MNKEREQVWQERIAQWQTSGMSMRGYAMEHGLPVRQMGYWVRRLAKSPVVPALLPARVTSGVATTVAAAPISLRSERGWTLSLPGDVPAAWLAELVRGL